MHTEMTPAVKQSIKKYIKQQAIVESYRDKIRRMTRELRKLNSFAEVNTCPELEQTLSLRVAELQSEIYDETVTLGEYRKTLASLETILNKEL